MDSAARLSVPVSISVVSCSRQLLSASLKVLPCGYRAFHVSKLVCPVQSIDAIGDDIVQRGGAIDHFGPQDAMACSESWLAHPPRVFRLGFNADQAVLKGVITVAVL